MRSALLRIGVEVCVGLLPVMACVGGSQANAALWHDAGNAHNAGRPRDGLFEIIGV
jgi:hypothetical protein